MNHLHVTLLQIIVALGQGQLDPLGQQHIPIGVSNSLDSLKTFVEAEGNFSPGVGSYGVYFWVFDKTAGRLFAPTMDSVKCQHGLADGRYLIPWSKWSAGDITVKMEIRAGRRNAETGRNAQKAERFPASSAKIAEIDSDSE